MDNGQLRLISTIPPFCRAHHQQHRCSDNKLAQGLSPEISKNRTYPLPGAFTSLGDFRCFNRHPSWGRLLSVVPCSKTLSWSDASIAIRKNGIIAELAHAKRLSDFLTADRDHVLVWWPSFVVLRRASPVSLLMQTQSPYGWIYAWFDLDKKPASWYSILTQAEWESSQKQIHLWRI